MSNSIAPGSSADVNVRVTALTANPNVPVTYKTIILKKNLVNGVNTLTQEMMSSQNTKYVIKYDYVLGENITVPADCVLEFEGGSISGAYTITGANTSIQAGLVKIFNTDVTLAGTWNVVEAYPEWFGAKGDGVTDDTLALQKLNGRNIKLSDKTYLCSNLVYNAYTCIRGENKYKSCLKQKDSSTGDFIRFEDWNDGDLENVRIEGGSNINADASLYMQALVKILNYTEKHNPDAPGGYNTQDKYTYHSTINNVLIIYSKFSGLSVIGNDKQDSNKTTKWNWIFRITNIWVENCDAYGIYDGATDNIWANINVSHCGLTNLLLEGASEVYNGMKLDGESGYILGDDAAAVWGNRVDGAALSIIGHSNIITGLDVQSMRYKGISIDGSNNYISGHVNNCGLGADENNQQYCPALYFYSSEALNNNNKISLVVYQINNTYIGNCVISYRYINRCKNNDINVLYFPSDGSYNNTSYKTYIDKLKALKYNNNNVIIPNEEYYDNPNVKVAYIEGVFDGSQPMKTCLLRDWGTIFSGSTSTSPITPIGAQVVDGDMQFIVSLKNRAGRISNPRAEQSWYGGTIHFNDYSIDDPLEVTYANASLENLYSGSIFKECAALRETNNIVSKWFIPNIRITRIISKYVKVINKLMEALGGDTIIIDSTAHYWTCDRYNNSTHFFCYNFKDCFAKVLGMDESLYYRPVAYSINNSPRYKAGPTTLRTAMISGLSAVTVLSKGHRFFDTTLNKALYWTGDTTVGDNGWVDAEGNNPSQS